MAGFNLPLLFFMKLKILLSIIILLFNAAVYGQQNICADSSYRIKYIFGNGGAIFFNTPDTSGRNIFTGNFNYGQIGGIALLRTTWGDSMLWAKKVNLNGFIRSTIASQDGAIIGTGVWGGLSNAELLISKIDTNGIIKWIKRFAINQPISLNTGGGYRNIIAANNALYFTIGFNGISIVAKLDLNGNIIWSRGFWMNSPYGLNSPVYNSNDNTVVIFGNSGFNNVSAGVITYTKLNDANGSFIESGDYKTIADATIAGAYPTAIKYNADNTYTISGYSITDNNGSPLLSQNMFNTLLDGNLNPIHNYYYINNVLIVSFDIDFNNQKQHAFLGFENNILLNNYFITFGKNDEVLRSRKFSVPPNFFALSYNLNLDDKQNVHFLFNYDQGNKTVCDYARISNLAPNGTLGCFGKDTSILTRYPFTLIKEPFVWDNTASNVITSNDVPYTEDTAIVTKELVCKIVSLCNNIKINGPAAACVGVPVRYTASRNNGCLKNLDWFIDTTATTIVSTEGDSAITLKFKKTFTGYIRAALTDCVVKDSFLVKAVVPKMLPLINRKDSLLCPGKTLTLTANAGYTNYRWQNTTAGQQFTVNNTGLYKITALDSCGAAQKDSISVTQTDTSLTIPATQTICLYDTAFIVLPNDVTNITWQPTGNSLLNNKTLLLYPQQTTVYTITAGRSLNCVTVKNTEVVIKNCPQTVFIPNSFTPNNDTRNDIFKPIISQPLAFYRFAIYNRYGQTIFETGNQQLGWDGIFKGSRQPQGGYIYQCSYRFAGNTVQKNANGYFILLR